MLCLGRRIGETIIIGDNITITVLEINGKQAKIGINAPKNIDIHREEVYIRIREHQEVTANDK